MDVEAGELDEDELKICLTLLGADEFVAVKDANKEHAMTVFAAGHLITLLFNASRHPALCSHILNN